MIYIVVALFVPFGIIFHAFHCLITLRINIHKFSTRFQSISMPPLLPPQHSTYLLLIIRIYEYFAYNLSFFSRSTSCARQANCWKKNTHLFNTLILDVCMSVLFILQLSAFCAYYMMRGEQNWKENNNLTLNTCRDKNIQILIHVVQCTILCSTHTKNWMERERKREWKTRVTIHHFTSHLSSVRHMLIFQPLRVRLNIVCTMLV